MSRMLRIVFCGLLVAGGFASSVPVQADPAPGKSGKTARRGPPPPGDPATVAPEKSKESRPSRTRPVGKTSAPGPANFTSRHFLIHTDLPPKEALELLKRMENMLTLVSKYFGKQPVGIIECYIVKSLDNWPAEAMQPGGVLEPGLQSLMTRAGVTHTRVRRSGANFAAKATVYAVVDHGTPLHEAVHAYCGQAFGRVGPVWYSEGMAEMGHYWQENDFSVNALDIVINYLRNAEPKPLEEIVSQDQQTGDNWRNYAWRWALCHLLSNNNNYSQRFRPLGMGMLADQDVSFEQTYGSMQREIEFEYRLFLKYLQKGYRSDLNSWDWKAKFRRDKAGVPMFSRIDAGHGWQASKLTVVKGEEYEYSAAGTWSTGKEPEVSNVTADGDATGKGRLVGVLFKDYELSEEFPLGAFGTFTAPADGDLFLRCQDDWSSMADNKGKMSVKLKLKGKGTPLTAPKVEPPKAKPAATAAKPAEKTAKAKPPEPMPKSDTP